MQLISRSRYLQQSRTLTSTLPPSFALRSVSVPTEHRFCTEVAGMRSPFYCRLNRIHGCAGIAFMCLWQGFKGLSSGYRCVAGIRAAASPPKDPANDPKWIQIASGPACFGGWHSIHPALFSAAFIAGSCVSCLGILGLST